MRVTQKVELLALLPSSDGSFQLVAPTKYGLKTCLARPAGGVKSPPEGGVHGGSSTDESTQVTMYKVDTHGRLIGAPQALTDLAWGAVMASEQHAQHCPSVTVRVPAEMATATSLPARKSVYADLAPIAAPAGRRGIHLSGPAQGMVGPPPAVQRPVSAVDYFFSFNFNGRSECLDAVPRGLGKTSASHSSR